MTESKYELEHYPDEKVFRMTIDGEERGVVNYTIENDGKYGLTYAGVPAELRGRGLGYRLVIKTFEYLEENDIEARAYCWFIRSVARESDKWSKIIEH